MVSGAGVCWATTGLFSTLLFNEGIDPISVASTRSALAAVIFLVYLLVFHPKLLVVNKKQLVMLALGGSVGITLFNIFYMNAINAAGMSTAVVLLYTSPVFAVILSRIFLKEPLTTKKVIALIIAISGILLVVEAYELHNLLDNPLAILVGLGAGLSFGTLSVLGKYLTGTGNRLTASFYLLFTGSLFLSLIHPPWIGLAEIRYSPSLLLALGALVIISTLAAHSLYIAGLSYLEAGKASIAVAIEPVAAILLAFFFLDERLVTIQYIGVALVLSAVILLRLHSAEALPK